MRTTLPSLSGDSPLFTTAENFVRGVPETITSELGQAYRYAVDPENGNITEISSSNFDESWQNWLLPQDVNEDGRVEPIDALLVINRLNSTIRDGSPTLEEPVFANRDLREGRKFDVDGDGNLEPYDALQVVNLLNTLQRGGSYPVNDPDADDARTEVHTERRYVQELEYQAFLATNGYTAASGALPDNLVGYIDTRTERGTYRRLYTYVSSSANEFTAFGNIASQSDWFRPAGTATEFKKEAETSYTYDAYGYIDKVYEALELNAFGGVATEREIDFDYDRNGRLLKLIEPIDIGIERVSSYRYDAFDNLLASSVTNVIPSLEPGQASTSQVITTYYVYDAIGRTRQIATPNPTIDHSLDEYGTPFVATPASWTGRLVSTMNYDENSNLTSLSETAGSSTRTHDIQYDKLDRPIKIQLPEAEVYDARYSTGANTSKEAIRPTTVMVYDNLGNLKASLDPLLNETIFHYDEWSREIASVSNPARSKFDATTRTAALASTEFTGLSQDIETGFLIARVDYDVAQTGRMRDPASLEGNLEYVDSLSWRVTYMDPLNNVTQVTNDFLGRPTRYARLGGQNEEREFVSRIEYGADGAILSTTDPEGHVTDFGYNGLGLLDSITKPDVKDHLGAIDSPETTFVYDAAGRLTSMTDPLGRETLYTLNMAGQTKVITAPALLNNEQSPTTSLTFDAIGNTIEVKDGLGHAQQTTFDRLLRPDHSIDAAGNLVDREYDLFGNLTSLTDANANVTSWTYDSLNRATSETITNDTDTNSNDIYGPTRLYWYDQVGNLREVQDRNSRRTIYNYDNLYRLDEEYWGAEKQFGYRYDLVGNVTNQSAYNAADYSFVYDDFYRPTGETQIFAVAGGTFRNAGFSRTFDNAGNVTQTVFDQIEGEASSQIYQNDWKRDALYRITEISQSGPNVANKSAMFGYDVANQVRQIDRRSSSTDVDVTTLMAYDQAGRLKSISHIDPSVVLAEAWDGMGDTSVDGVIAAYAFDYDVANRLELFDSLADNLRVQYTHDSRDQLTEELYLNLGLGGTHPTLSSTEPSLSYDDNGNRFGSDNASLSPDRADNRVLEDASYTYKYDGEGNIISRSSKGDNSEEVFVWDFRNRLVKVEYKSPTGITTKTVNQLYDANNRWIGQTIDSNGDSVVESDLTRQFVYDFGQVAAAYQGGVLTNRYLWSPAVDQLLADEVIGSTANEGIIHWALTDHLGSIRDLVNTDSQVIDHAVYDAFGNVLGSASDAAIDSLFGYTGRPFDAETDFQNNHHRWYDSQSGRWLSKDPIGFAAGDSNLYRYVGNQATTNIDPNGLDWIKKVGAVVEAGKIIYANGRRASIRNFKFAGQKVTLDTLETCTGVAKDRIARLRKKFPDLSISYNKKGFPTNFSDYAEVTLGRLKGLNGDHSHDTAIAWAELKKRLSKEEYDKLFARRDELVFHHKSTTEMDLVDADLHKAFAHTGPAAGMANSAAFASIGWTFMAPGLADIRKDCAENPERLLEVSNAQVIGTGIIDVIRWFDPGIETLMRDRTSEEGIERIEKHEMPHIYGHLGGARP